MYIEPNTNIRILKNCPLNSDYLNTIYFDDPETQKNYFIGLTKHRLTKQSYQRISSGYMRVEIKVEDLYDCNYLMFQNESFGNKWFYAFITSVEYVNNITSEIGFSIDVMQTWFFDYELLPSFVVREHSATDVIGENTVPESLEHGEYITTATSFTSIGNLYVYLLATELVETPIPSDVILPPQLLGGLPMPCYVFKLGPVWSFTGTIVQSVALAYAEAGKEGSIVGVFTAPENFVSTTPDIRINNITGAPRTLSKTPRNKKLYTYPYCCNAVVCGGQGKVFRYELFNNHTPTFQSRSGFGMNLKVAITPTNYAGNSFDIENTVSLSGFPILPWTTNYFQNWIAQNKASLIYGTVRDTISGAVGAAKMYPIVPLGDSEFSGGSRQFLSSVDSMINRGIQVYEHSIIPDQMVGTADSTDALAIDGKLGFYNYCRSIKPEFVERLDNYFDMFGYATNLLKVPNRNVRPHWCFTQTIRCNIKGEIPESAINEIVNIYDKGITFWKNPDEIGNYSLDNRV